LIAPGLQEQVFPAASRQALVIVSQIGVVLYTCSASAWSSVPS
jgi:hypothetical protein